MTRLRRLTVDRLHLQNFKGARDVDLIADSRSLLVYGDNATGKTTLHDAFTWLLFGKDARDAADFGVKTVTPDGQAVTGLDHVVEADLRIWQPDGAQHTVQLRRTYREKWTKRRGSSQAEFTGHETQYHVDGVPTRKGDYEQTVAGLMDLDLFRLLTDPLHMSGGLHWTARRRLLVDMVGDVTPAEVVAAHPHLQALIDAAGRHDLADYRKVLIERRKALNADIERVPVRIDELTRSLPDDPADVDDLQAQLAAARDAEAAARDALQEAKAGGSLVDLRLRRRQLVADVDAAVAAATAAQRTAVSDATVAHQEAVRAQSAALADLQAARRQHDQLRGEDARLRQRVDDLRAEWRKVTDTPMPASDHATACPTCGQPLPADQIDAAGRAHADAWRAQQAERLQGIRERGQAAAADLLAAERRVSDSADVVARCAHAADDATAACGRADDALQAATVALQAADVDSDPGVIAARDALAAVDARLADDADRGAADILAADARMQAAVQATADAADRLAAARAAVQTHARIAQLRDEERALAQQIEDADAHLQMADDYTRVSVQLLTNRINARFDGVQFRLFADQINGGVQEVCETTVDGVPWADLNHGAQINAGLAIISTLSRHYGFAPPVWIDNAEAVTHLGSTPGQQVRLIVSATDATLRVVPQEE